ncbi:MAG: SgcJ/EcaC family oxidoreductase [bacterium]|nr:SgcJ/EcaC family oxidoreductase [bacterium]
MRNDFQTATQLGSATQAEDEQAIRQIVQALADAWNSGDSEAWSVHVADDIYHTVWNGRFVEGKEALTTAHQEIFDTIYKGSRQKLTVRWVRFLRPDVAAVQYDGEVAMVGKEEPFRARPLALLTKQDGRWLIEVFQNTPIMPFPKAAKNGNGRSS